jgi:hypothetical protein
VICDISGINKSFLPAGRADFAQNALEPFFSAMICNIQQD